MNSPVEHDFDVVVVGGGPGGSTLSALVAMQGHRVVLLEKEQFPRYQIGESLLPSTIHGICRILGVADELARVGFTLKRGGTFKWGSNPNPWTFAFAISPRFAGPTSYAYQVERMKFDNILLNNARRVGVDVHERCSVVDVIVDNERVCGATYDDPHGERRAIRARFVVDASGNKSRIYSYVGGARHYSKFFKNLALFGYFEGGKRLPEPNAGNILTVAFEDGWFWYIPLSERLTSVGAVVNRDMAYKVQGDTEQALLELIGSCPLIRDYLCNAQRATYAPYDQLRVRKDYSYCQSTFWRPGMVLIGDAACFVDPVFSSGVHLATYSAFLAARSVNSCLAGSMDEKRSFREFEARYRREYGRFYEFIMAFYDMHPSEQSYFWKAKKVTKCEASELEAFVELVGGLSSWESAFSGTDSVTARFMAASEELAVAAERVTGNKDEHSNPLLDSKIVGTVLEEGAQLQVRALMGKETGQEAPLFPDGLVPSHDGMRWVVPQ